MTHKPVCSNKGAVTSFPEGTVVRTRNNDNPQSTWTYKNGLFVNSKSGKTQTVKQLMPEGIRLDTDGDGKYTKKDLTSFKNKDKSFGELSACLDEGLSHSNIYTPFYGGAFEDAQVDKKGNLSFTTTTGIDHNKIDYSIALPKDKK